MTIEKKTIGGREFTVRHFTVRERMELDKLRKEDADGWETYLFALKHGAGLSDEDIGNLNGDDGDDLFISVLEHNKPPLSQSERLRALSTRATAET